MNAAEEVESNIVAELRIPLADITGVIEFYSMLYSEPVGDTIIRVCTSPSPSSSWPPRGIGCPG